MKPLATQICISVLGALVLLGGCRGWESVEPPVHLNQNMDTQAKLKPYRNSEFFADGRAMRTPPEGTVARGKLKEDDHFYRGKASGQLVDSFPEALPVNADLLKRGQERYNIYCTPCHGQAGDGQGLVSKRLPVKAPTFHSSYLYEQKLGHFFDVISNGIRSMPAYAQQIPEADRWAIVSYVRALQVGQNPKALEAKVETEAEAEAGAEAGADSGAGDE
jgi:mono/diheme cytochrome c family protein